MSLIMGNTPKVGAGSATMARYRIPGQPIDIELACYWRTGRDGSPE
jgi:hypothetical protein